MSKKIYIRYCRPYESENDEPPIEDIWSEGDRPPKRLADGLTFVTSVALGDERVWDGVE